MAKYSHLWTAGIVGAFVGAGINLARMAPAPVVTTHETGPFRMFTQNAAGRYEAGFDPAAQFGKATAAVYCFPATPDGFCGRQAGAVGCSGE